MDEVTQQNSALGRRECATAKTLESQAEAMDQRVSFFRLNEAAPVQHRGANGATRPRSSALGARRRRLAAPGGAQALAGGDGGQRSARSSSKE